jgi:glutaminyl-tRNA synthetase
VDDSTRSPRSADFIRAIVQRHLDEGRYVGVVTRFPPEPNGFLHIGHAQSITLNFGIAEDFGGRCHLRFDDTNPITEEERYARAIREDVHWLGFDWGDHLYYASDYFQRMYDAAVTLIRKGKAYVDSQSEEEIRQGRGTVTTPGTEGPFRNRSVEENLELFRRMREGEFEEGSHVLRARIDMTSPNMLMRDPVLYRIRHAHHYRTGDDWCIYPLYDFAHCLEDAFEDVTHSVCTLEFENNRELYDWILDEVGFSEPRPHQYEFARLNLEYTVLSKRKLIRLVKEGHVAGWDDPRMPTVAGLRRRGVTPEAIRSFAVTAGVTRTERRVDMALLEHAIRDDLNLRVPRVMAVLDPLRVVVTNYPEGQEEMLDAPLYPRDVPLEGSRPLPFGRELVIDRDDFREDPPKGYFRLAPGREVRLRYGYFIRCDEVVKDPATGEVVELRCSYDPETRGGNAPDGRKVKGTIHWLSAAHALSAEVRLYDRLFSQADPDDVPEEGDFLDNLNPDSLEVVGGALVEPSIGEDSAGTRYQFERLGYFVSDPVDSGPGHLVFNRTVTLRDSWARKEARRSPARETGDRTGPGASEAERAGVGQAPPSLEVETSGGGTEGTSRGDVRPGAGRSDRDGRRRVDPELAARMARYEADLDLTNDEADLLSGDRGLSDFFEAALGSHGNARGLASWLVNELPRELGDRSLEDTPLEPSALARLVALTDEEVLSRSGARELFSTLVSEGGDPDTLLEQKDLRQVSDEDALLPIVEDLLVRFPDKVQEYRDGKTGLLGFFVGQAMRATEGKGDPRLLSELLTTRLEGGQGS